MTLAAPSPRLLVALASLGSALVLAGALGFEALGFPPCDLCLLQRWPHLAALMLGAVVLTLRLPAWAARMLMLAGALAALTTAVLGLYHSGVERHIFAGPDSCTSGPVGTLSAADLMAQINAAPLVRCDEIVWDIFGLTMPNLNALASTAFAALWVAAFLARRRTAD